MTLLFMSEILMAFLNMKSKIVLGQMLMATTTYLVDNDDHNAAQLLPSGFSGTLRS